VTIEKFVSAGFTGFPKSVYCQTIDNPINLNTFATNPGGTWTGAGVSAGSSMFDPNQVAVGTNSVFYKTHSMPTPSLCPDEKVLTLNVAKPTEVSPRTNPAVACVPFEAILNIPGVDDGFATWIFGDGSDSKQELTTSHVYTSPGHYTATLVYVNKAGCPSTPVIAATYTVNELPTPDFVVPEEVFISDPLVQFTNLTPSINSNKYYWRVEGVQKSNEVNPSLPFTEIGRYHVTLLAENPNTTCKAEITKPLDVKNDFNVFIPSSFSPNFDGLNDLFVPVFSAYGLDAKSYEMEVFDRWGHSVFRTKEVAKGWDGSVFNKGEPLKEDVYVYKLKYKDLDGNLYNKIGHISLIK
ncbi:MAG: gliding motility-associated C-terminal domain-containing protein, partial [Bacteroidia bacterium]|nr:gliding motility-associated C-terminal domain-containing protein [Bacteroidia bacterium]